MAYLLIGLFAALSPAQAALQRYAFEHAQMGTLFRITVYAPSQDRARQACQAAFARIDSLNAVFSDYDPDSELSRLSDRAGDGRFHRVSHDLWSLLSQAQRIARHSDGAFDITVGALTRLWRWSFRRQEWPPADRLAAARASVGYEALVLSEERQAVKLTRPGLRLDAGGIAKGYAVDAAMAVLRKKGLTRALVDGGGDLLAGDPPPGAPGWSIDLPAGAGADSTYLLHQEALATSGDTYKYLAWEGRRYSHIIDPRTGLGVTHGALVTVRAPTCALADALASTLTVLDPDEHRAFMQPFDEAAARIYRPTEPPSLNEINAFFQPE